MFAAPVIRAPDKSQPGDDISAGIFREIEPAQGIDTGIVFGDALQKVIAAGVIDPAKLRGPGHGLPPWVERLLATPSQEPILFTRERAPYLVNLLWPIGLANRARFNRQSPIGNVGLPGYASTGGWTLGRAPNGYVYFGSVDAVPMTPGQAELALAIATNTFRPCCDNSTFYQDCNHGSALLGLIELAASQGATPEAIYRIALAANAAWFPEEYARTALYCRYFEGIRWQHVPPRLILSASYSSLSGWERHIDAPLRRAGIHLPVKSGKQPAACGI